MIDLTYWDSIMINTPSFKEDHISQIPALQFLQNLGYRYISPEEALKERKNKLANVLLENILEKFGRVRFNDG